MTHARPADRAPAGPLFVVDPIAWLRALGPAIDAVLPRTLSLSMQLPATLAPIRVDEADLALALIGLVMDAACATGPGGDLRIEAVDLPAHHAVELSVIYAGTPTLGGGLLQAHGLAASAGGALRVDDAADGSTRVTLRLPVLAGVDPDGRVHA